MPKGPHGERRLASAARPKAREVEVVRSDYQPSAAELAEDARVNATFDEAVEALTKPVSIRYVDEPDHAE